MMSLAEAHALLPGSQLLGDGGLRVLRVHSDSRSITPGDLFVALRGERFDANNFLPQARAAGAVAAIAERGLGASGLPGLQVAAAEQALAQLAAAWRKRFTGPLVAVTGSNGKTTVTQMVAAIFRAWVGELSLATAGNFNNHIGVPLTLLRLRPSHRAAVLELGMNHPGEISLLARLVQPTVALVNNAQREHQEFMATVEAVALENGSVISALPADGTAVLPLADAYTPLWRELAGTRRVWTFAADTAGRLVAEPYQHVQAQGLAAEPYQHVQAQGLAADPYQHVQAQGQWAANAGQWELQLFTPVGGADTTLALAGLHNLANAAAATACALAAGAPLAAVALGLAAFEAMAGRSQTLRLTLAGRAVTVIDDSYNANPDSVLAAIDMLANLPAPRWLVLGDMGEVGAQGPRFHAEVGARAQALGIDEVWAVGTLCAHTAATRHFATLAQALQALTQGQAPHAASVLVKGSRFMQMEAVVQALRAASLNTLGAADTDTGTGTDHYNDNDNDNNNDTPRSIHAA